MTPKPPAASLVILCHNDGDFLRECLAGVFRHTRDVRYEIILVDNATQDGSGPYLRRLAKRSNVRLIENAENRFFAGGNNQGIQASTGRYVVLLNADAVVGPEWLSRMIRCAEREPSIGLVGPCTNGAVGPQLVSQPGYSTTRDFARFAQDWARHYSGWWKEAHRLIGFCLLVKREVIDRAGLLDERFGPGGYEDYDYCMRARQAGFKIALAQDVFVHHYGGRGYTGMDYGHMRRVNREILARKWSQFIVHALDDMDQVMKEASRHEGIVQSGPARRVAAGR